MTLPASTTPKSTKFNSKFNTTYNNKNKTSDKKLITQTILQSSHSIQSQSTHSTNSTQAKNINEKHSGNLLTSPNQSTTETINANNYLF